MSARVAIPVHFATLTMYLEKGRRWNAVEHMLLYAVCEEPMSALQLSVVSKMELRLVIEVMIRLMRAGWVELESSPEGFRFQATSAGKVNVEKDELPVITSPKKRRASFVIERATGSIFRARDFTLYNRHDYQKIKETVEIIELPVIDIEPMIRQDQIILTLLNDDEECKHVDAIPGRFGEKFAIVTVVGGKIEGLPARASMQLRKRILGAVTRPYELNTPVISKEDVGSDSLLRIKFDPINFIVGGKEHEVTLKILIRKARSRILIHSTFIDAERFRAVLPDLHDAAKRGVRIDILWGKSDRSTDIGAMHQVVAKCREMLIGDDVRERITIHSFSTNSHAKILIVDNERGKMIAVLGSCNWLSSGFNSTEASVRLDDPAIVSQIVGHLGKMAAGPSMEWTSFATDLAVQATNLRSAPAGSSGISVDARLVFGFEHSYFVRKARDEAKSRIVITSHRFSHNAETLVLRPTKAAVKEKDVNVKLYYGQFDGESDGAVAAEIAENARVDGIRHEQIRDPNLHAKILAWDDNSVVVSSQNWLSADPNDNDMYSEIGVYLSGTNLAQELLILLNSALPKYD
jgi:phosphatidylserine/phosphatidylglycerophosphate/cardiolipin synthase-like enzyme